MGNRFWTGPDADQRLGHHRDQHENRHCGRHGEHRYLSYALLIHFQSSRALASPKAGTSGEVTMYTRSMGRVMTFLRNHKDHDIGGAENLGNDHRLALINTERAELIYQVLAAGDDRAR